MKVKDVDNKEFIRLWQTSGSIREMADRFGCDPLSATQHASFLRGKGIILKDYRKVIRKASRDEYDDLAAYAKELADGVDNNTP